MRILVVLLLAAGCAAPAVAPTLAKAPAASPVMAYDINPRPRDAVRDGGTLRWGIAGFPVQWNAGHVDGDQPDVRTVMGALLPRAFRSDERGRVTPDTDYVLAATAEGQVVTYRLNPKAAWSDGTPITWADYAAQWHAMSGKDPAYRAVAPIGYREIAGVARGRDDHEVRVTFARPFGDWRSLFSPLYPKTTNGSPAAFNSDWIDRVPLTAGPFRLQKLDQAARTVTLARDPKWWGAPAKLDTIVFKAAGESAFVHGDLDVYALSQAGLTKARQARNAVVRQAACAGFRQFTFNGETPALSDVRVRQALALGLDRAAIARSDLAGLGWPAVPLDNHFFLNSQDGYQSNVGDLGRYDPGRAGQLLDAAGWRLDRGVRVKDGRPLTLRFVIPYGLPLAASEGAMAQEMLRRIGVTLTIREVSGADFFTKFVIPGDYDIAPFSYAGSPYPLSGNFGIYVSGSVTSGDDRRWDANLGRIGGGAVDAALAAAASELDPAKRRDLVNEADRLVWQEVNVLPLYQRPESVAVRATLANVGARGLYDLRYQDIGYVK
jgi:peptide/nickel transport system substrate-binding protein